MHYWTVRSHFTCSHSKVYITHPGKYAVLIDPVNLHTNDFIVLLSCDLTGSAREVYSIAPFTSEPFSIGRASSVQMVHILRNALNAPSSIPWPSRSAICGFARPLCFYLPFALSKKNQNWLFCLAESVNDFVSALSCASSHIFDSEASKEVSFSFWGHDYDSLLLSICDPDSLCQLEAVDVIRLLYAVGKGKKESLISHCYCMKITLFASNWNYRLLYIYIYKY